MVAISTADCRCHNGPIPGNDYEHMQMKKQHRTVKLLCGHTVSSDVCKNLILTDSTHCKWVSQ